MGKGFFSRREIDEKYDKAEVIRDFGLDPAKPISDGYGHYQNCRWFVQEAKGTDIDWAVEQLKSTVEQLENNGRQVDKIFIVLEGAFKSKMYESRNGVLYVRGAKNPYKIRGKIVRVVRESEIRSGDISWLFW